jgi:hypothetical protein
VIYRPLLIADKCSVFLLVLPGFLKDFADHEKYLDGKVLEKAAASKADAAAMEGKDYLPT